LDRCVVLLDEGQAAKIRDYALAFNKRSKDGSSKANLMPETGATSWGVLFTVDGSSLEGLNNAEGAPNHYRSERVIVESLNGKCDAMVYFAQPDKLLTTPDSPWDWYLALILAGAKACPDIPLEWLKNIRQIGNSKISYGKPPKEFAEAVTQLRAAGYDRWQELLINGD